MWALTYSSLTIALFLDGLAVLWQVSASLAGWKSQWTSPLSCQARKAFPECFSHSGPAPLPIEEWEAIWWWMEGAVRNWGVCIFPTKNVKPVGTCTSFPYDNQMKNIFVNITPGTCIPALESPQISGHADDKWLWSLVVDFIAASSTKVFDQSNYPLVN